MKRHLLCIPCTIRAAYDIAARATHDEELQEKVVIEVLKWLKKVFKDKEITPNILHTYAFRVAKRITGNNDPFDRLKKESNDLAVQLIPHLKSEYEKRSFRDGLRLAALSTICGNSIDFEVEDYHFSFSNLVNQLKNCLEEPLAINDLDKLMELLPRAKKIVYLHDNAGEVVFDKFFIEVITRNYPVKVVSAVKSGPVLNDATLNDAAQIKLEEFSQVVTTGSDSVGLVLKECSAEFLEHVREADLIISKGQGYYESLTELEHLLRKPILYMLKAKCIVVARSLNINVGDNVIKFSYIK
jgi:uncharacterized protein with ATP-grasp and redox domains